MKGELKKIEDKWVVEYSEWITKGGKKGVLGGYTRGIKTKTLPLHFNFVTMTDYVWVKGIKVYDGDEVKFTQVLVNPMGREVDPNDLGQNQSGCVWYAKLTYDENEEDLGYTTKGGVKVSDEMVRATMVPKEYFGKDEQKQHLIDMMESDEELGLYNDNFDSALNRFKNTLNKKYNESQEIKIEDIFNDKKKEKVKRGD